MRIFLFGSILFFLTGCVGNDGLRSSAVADANVVNLSKISLGMKQNEVLSVMKDPYSEEKISLDGAQFEVWFYITSPTVLGQTKMVAANLTPLTFKNGELIGWGSSYYHYLMKRKKRELKAEATKVGTKTAPSKDMPNQGSQTPPEGAAKKPNWGPVTPQNPQQKPAEDSSSKKGGTQGSSSGKPSPSSQKTTSSHEEAKILIGDAQKASSEQKPSSEKPKEKKPNSENEKKVPLDKEDDDMLDESSDQEFNQT